MNRFDPSVHSGLRRLALVSAVGLLVGLPAWGVGVGEEYTLSRYSVGSGGQMSSADGETELSMTIGQPDANTMTGEGYSLDGGFLFAVSPGDCIIDGEVNALDHGAFTACLTGPSGGAISEDCRCFDLDRNGAVDMRDAAGIQRSFTGP